MADLRIPEDKASEVFELAARLYARQNQSYTVEELVQAGSDASIPPEFIQKALNQLQAREEETRELKERARQHQKFLTLGGLALGAALLGWGALTYNSLSASAQTVDLAWAQVENQFQRRADLIPNLVNVTRSAAQQEQALVTQLTQARQEYENAVGQPEKLAAAEQVNQALTQFQTTVLSSPQFQSSQLYIGLQDELAGTENRIATERMRYNQAVSQYNHQVETFPTSLVSGPLGFESKPLFEATSREVPVVNP
ncbi:LemA family protein [Pseudanabaena sp. FACHB-2040]|uniref:LemA family protein n=1 Tax=Pseudanabaena sp. FACHB-2040 TaxID=2692859 RepID=UPI001683D91C|nr:LemA family protein [Pseudanabaena sp. FACHB-2040]MBD2257882.1 LemA family protein [Pseudanabaena sp. FACHB-2040]